MRLIFCVSLGVIYEFLQASLAIELVAVHLQLSTAPPELLLLEVQTRDGGGYTLAQVYTADPVSSCPEYTAQGIPCSAYENLTNVIVCPVNFSGVNRFISHPHFGAKVECVSLLFAACLTVSVHSIRFPIPLECLGMWCSG